MCFGWVGHLHVVLGKRLVNKWHGNLEPFAVGIYEWDVFSSIHSLAIYT